MSEEEYKCERCGKHMFFPVKICGTCTMLEMNGMGSSQLRKRRNMSEEEILFLLRFCKELSSKDVEGNYWFPIGEGRFQCISLAEGADDEVRSE